MKEIHDNQSAMVITDVGSRRRATVSGFYANPIEVFDGHIYGKGACVLHMLRNYLGEELFWKSINHYIHKHAFGNVETNDLKIAIEESTGYNLKWFFDEWLYKSGFPEFDVTWSWDSLSHQVTVEVDQTQKIDSLTGVFVVPVDIQIWADGKAEDYLVTIKNVEEKFKFPCPNRPQLILFDKGSAILKRVSYDKSIDEWLFQLNHATDAVDRSIAIDHLRGYVDTARVNDAIINVMLHDSFWDNRRSAAFTLSSAKTPVSIKHFIAAYRDRDARVRAAVITAFANYPGNLKATELVRSAFDNDSSYSVVAAALVTLTKIDAEHERIYCDVGLQRDSHREIIRIAAIGRLAEIGGNQAFAAIEKYTMYGIDRDLRINAMLTLSRVWHDKEEVVDRMIDLLSDPLYQVRRTAIDILGVLKNKGAVEPLKKRVEIETDGRLVKLVNETLEKIQEQH